MRADAMESLSHTPSLGKHCSGLIHCIGLARNEFPLYSILGHKQLLGQKWILVVCVSAFRLPIIQGTLPASLRHEHRGLTLLTHRQICGHHELRLYRGPVCNRADLSLTFTLSKLVYHHSIYPPSPARNEISYLTVFNVFALTSARRDSQHGIETP